MVTRAGISTKKLLLVGGSLYFSVVFAVLENSVLETNGNVKSALRLLSNGGKGKVLSLDPSSTSTVRDVLLSKHPPPGPICPDSVLLRETPSPTHDPHPIVFDSIDGDLIRRMHGFQSSRCWWSLWS